MIPGQLVALEIVGVVERLVTLLGGGGGGGTWFSSSSITNATLFGRAGVGGRRISAHWHSFLAGFDEEGLGSWTSGMLDLLEDFLTMLFTIHSINGDFLPVLI